MSVPSSSTLSSADQAIIDDELAILARVQQSLALARQKRGLNYHRIGERLQSLREEAARAKSADLPALFDQMNTQRALIERTQDVELPNMDAPYFAHMRLQEKDKVRDVLLGHVGFLECYQSPIIDWRHAPISKIFFNYRQSDLYDLELPGRTAEGTLLLRHVLSFQNGQLRQIFTPDRLLQWDPEHGWQGESLGHGSLLTGGAGSAQRTQHFGTGMAGRANPEVSALLDTDQYAILNADEDEHLLILGGAGCGKTTVALHRVAALNFRDNKRFAERNMVVIVPEEGIARLSRKLLEGLGLRKTRVTSFDAWVEKEARLILRKLPKQICQNTPVDVMRLKRHPAVRAAFGRFVEIQTRDLALRLDRKIPGSQAAQQVITERQDLPLLSRIRLAEKTFLASLGPLEAGDDGLMRRKAIHKIFGELERRAFNNADDRLDFFSNEALLREVIALSRGELGERHVRSTLKHAHEQAADSAAERYAGIDAERLETVDGRNLLEDDEDDLAGSIDREDFAFLLDLQRYKAGKHGHPSFDKLTRYTHMVIDEAQEMAAVELSVLGHSLTEDASVTIAGDAAQQTDPSQSFASWQESLSLLGVPPINARHLSTSYRSTRSIATYAHHILGPLAPSQTPETIRPGVPVRSMVFPSDGHAAIFLTDTLTTLMTEEPLASVAVLTKDYTSAEQIFTALSSVPKLRFVSQGDFEFRPGIDVTDANQVKGLEFDYVVIADANAGKYTSEPEDRRLLHVAATRAIHQLLVISVGRRSEIIPDQDLFDNDGPEAGQS